MRQPRHVRQDPASRLLDGVGVAEVALAEVSEAWPPYRTWAAACARQREQRTGEIAGR
jgi:hypothetical protein